MAISAAGHFLWHSDTVEYHCVYVINDYLVRLTDNWTFKAVEMSYWLISPDIAHVIVCHLYILTLLLDAKCFR